MRERNSNLTFSDDPIIYKNEKYYQVICIKNYRDYYAKRTIQKGEKGGYIHEKSIAGEPSIWIEPDKVVGAPVTETGRLTIVNYDYEKSSIDNYISFFKNAIPFWRLKCGTHNPSQINAIMFHSQMNIDIVNQIKDEEIKLATQHKSISEFKSRFFWILLGMIMESVVKIHIVIFRDETINLKSDRLWKKKTINVIKELLLMKHISSDEMRFLEKLNNSRNLVHFLDNEHVLPYHEYLNSVDDLLRIMYKLMDKEKEYKVEDEK